MTTVSTQLDVRKITARIGAEVRGVDLDRDLDPQTVAAIRAALNEHKALVFGGAHLDDEGQERFASLVRRPDHRAPDGAVRSTAPANVLPVDSENVQVEPLAHRRHLRAEPAAGRAPCAASSSPRTAARR